MPRVVGIDHLVLSVGDLARSKAFYGKVLGFLGFKLQARRRRLRRLEQRQDTVLDRAGRRAGDASASIARATSAFITTRSSSRAARRWTTSARFSRSTA